MGPPLRQAKKNMIYFSPPLWQSRRQSRKNLLYFANPS